MSAPHGIPTLYRGRRYRSRLEARWACFFDLVGWKYEYEPFDLPGWIPDFALFGEDGRQVLVEIKPTPRADVGKVGRAVKASNWSAPVFILDCAPTADTVNEIGDLISGLVRRSDVPKFWTQAGNEVQWKKPRTRAEAEEALRAKLRARRGPHGAK